MPSFCRFGDLADRRARYGSLYFAADTFQGCQRAEVSEDLPGLEHVEDQYVVGPIVDEGFWKDERARMDIDRGPCMRSQWLWDVQC